MVDPFTAASLYAVAQIAKGCTIAGIAGGVAGSATDRLLCKIAGETAGHFVRNIKEPVNHDLLKGIMQAYEEAFQYYAETVETQATAQDRPIAEKISELAEKKAAVGVAPAPELVACITPLIGTPGNMDAEDRFAGFVSAAVSELVKNIEAEIGETLPENFVALFTSTAPNGRESWENRLRLHLAETIKDEKRFGTRFKNIFIASNIADLVGYAVTLQGLAESMHEGIEKLHGKVDSVKSDTEQILNLQEQPKDLLGQRWKYCLNGDFEAAADCAERAVQLAKRTNDVEAQAKANRCAARDLADHIISKRLDDANSTKFKARIEEHIAELGVLGFPEPDLALEKALFARLDKRPDDARKYAEVAATGSDNPDNIADALMVQLQAFWQLDMLADGLELKEAIEKATAEVAGGDADLALQSTWIRTLIQAGAATPIDLQNFEALARKLLTDSRTTNVRAIMFIEEIGAELARAGEGRHLRSHLTFALELAEENAAPLNVVNIALQIAQIDAELGDRNGSYEHLSLAEKWLDTLRSDANSKDSWASRKAMLLVMRSRVASVLSKQMKEDHLADAINLRRQAFSYLTDTLIFVESNEALLNGDVAFFVADVEMRAGFVAAELGQHRVAAEHFCRARSDPIMCKGPFQHMAMRAWIGEAESLLFGGQPVESKTSWEAIRTTPLANEQQRNGAEHNIRWIDEHVLEPVDWLASDAAADIRRKTVSEAEGLRHTIAEQVAPLVDWFEEFPATDEAGHAYSELFDVWGRGGFSRIVAAVRADPLNAICVDATTIDEIIHMARVFCPLYDTVLVNWKGPMHPALGIVPMPDNLGPPGEYGGQGYMRTSDSLGDKDGWHAAIGWANYLPKSVSQFLAGEALPLVRSGRLVLLPAPLIGCTQNAVGWTSNLFVDHLLGGVVKTASAIVLDGVSNRSSHLLDLGETSIPFIDGVSLYDLNRILEDCRDWLLPMRRSIHTSIGSSNLRNERWDGVRPHLNDVREAFRQMDDRWRRLSEQHSDQEKWDIGSLEGTFSALERSDDKFGSDPITDQLHAIAGNNDDLGPWVPFWCLRRAGGQIDWTADLDNQSVPPDDMAKMQGFTSSVSQGWLYPGDGGPGMAAAIRVGSV